MTKKEIRKIYKQKRYTLSTSDRSKMDDLLLIQFQRLALPDDVRVLMSYWPLERHAEMDTHIYTRYLEHAIPGLCVTYPVVDFETSEMHPKLVDDDTDFEENEYGIPEPVNTDTVSPEDIDLVFVPLLAFDRKGYRVGYGKGYYDRFLKLCPHALAIGFSYFEPIDKIEDTNQFDVPLKYCITPQHVYEF